MKIIFGKSDVLNNSRTTIMAYQDRIQSERDNEEFTENVRQG